MPPPDLAARRAISTNSPTIRSVGPNPSKSSASSDWLAVVGLALISTCFSLSRAESWVLFQNVGTSVANSFVGVALASVCGKRTFIVNVPWMVSPLEEIDFT